MATSLHKGRYYRGPFWVRRMTEHSRAEHARMEQATPVEGTMSDALRHAKKEKGRLASVLTTTEGGMLMGGANGMHGFVDLIGHTTSFNQLSTCSSTLGFLIFQRVFSKSRLRSEN